MTHGTSCKRVAQLRPPRPDVAVSITAGPVAQRTAFAMETLAQSTSTVPQPIALTTPLTILGGGTATGFENNVFTLSTASAVEGQEKAILMTASGEAKIAFTGTATGRFVLTRADDLLMLKMFNQKWRVASYTLATLATST